MGLITKLNESFGDTTLPQIRRDDFLSGDNNGVLFLGDFSDAFSWRGGTSTPTNGAVLYDIAEKNDAVLALFTNDGENIAGGGLDFAPDGVSPYSAATGVVELPAAVSSTIWNTGGTNEHNYAITMYGKFLDASWWDSDASIEQFMGSNIAYNTGDAWILAALQSGTNGDLSVRRDTGTSSQNSASSATGGRFKDNVSNAITQLVVHTYGDTLSWRYKTATTTVSGGGAALQTITHDYSSSKLQFGHSTAFGGDPRPLKRLYRMAVEDLTTSGRDPIAVADADWNRVISRFS
jgi:hypothetical protein